MEIYIKCFLIFCLGSFAVSAQSLPPPKVPFDTTRDSTYFAASAKLKKLFVEQVHSSCYQKRREMNIEYGRKLKSKGTYDVSKLPGDAGALKWLKDNWQKTEFASYEQAEREYYEITQAIFDCDEQHPEFSQYNFKMIMKYGPQIFTDMYMEVMKEYPDKW